MKLQKYEFLTRAAEPICHLEMSIGNEGIHRREKVRFRGGWAHVPIVSGNAVRNRIRAAAARAMFDVLDIEGDAMTEQAIRLLFNGGNLAGKGSAGTVSLDEYREICTLFPPLALLGGCVNNRIVPGRSVVSSLLTVCEESRHFVPAWAQEWITENDGWDTARSFIVEVQNVRADSLLDPAVQRYLTEPERARVNARLLASENASRDGDDDEGESSKSTLMPYKAEMIPRGTYFSMFVQAACHNPLDEDTLSTMVGVFLSNARVGGKIGTEHGLVVPVVGREMEVTKPSDTSNVTALGNRVGDVFRAHVRGHREQTLDWLRKVSA